MNEALTLQFWRITHLPSSMPVSMVYLARCDWPYPSDSCMIWFFIPTRSLSWWIAYAGSTPSHSMNIKGVEASDYLNTTSRLNGGGSMNPRLDVISSLIPSMNEWGRRALNRINL